MNNFNKILLKKMKQNQRQDNDLINKYQFDILFYE